MIKKTLALTIVALTMALAPQSVNARSNREPKTQKSDSTQIKSDIKDINSETQLEAYKLRLEYEKEEAERERKNFIDNEKLRHNHRVEMEQLNSDKTYYRAISDFMLIVACILLMILIPILLTVIYLRKSKEQLRERENLIDLVRSGIPITPEVVKLLGRNPNNETIATFGNKLKMPQNDLNYCMKRIAWALICLVIGFAFACITNSGMFFGFGAVVAVILVIQVASRYVVSRSINKYNDTTTKDNAQ